MHYLFHFTVIVIKEFDKDDLRYFTRDRKIPEKIRSSKAMQHEPIKRKFLDQ